jgi:dethiobiotin synthetase
VQCALHQGIRVLGLLGGSLPEDPDLATRLNVDELSAVTGVAFLGSIPEGAGALGTEEFRRMALENLDWHTLSPWIQTPN